MGVEAHQTLHKELNSFLKGIKNTDGKDMSPRRGNSGADIRAAFSSESRKQALTEFYKGPGAQYSAAAKSFFDHNNK
jgi:hypothetical protein